MKNGIKICTYHTVYILQVKYMAGGSVKRLSYLFSQEISVEHDLWTNEISNQIF